MAQYLRMLLVLSTLTHANPLAARLYPRSDQCTGLKDYFPCQKPGLPSSFCCPSGSKCISLASATTLLCCEDGNDCSNVDPISCDIQKLNATANPGSPVLTTELDKSLEKCGNGCCPGGFKCSKGSCIMTDSKNASLTSVSITSTSTATSNPNSKSPVSLASPALLPKPSHNSSYPGKAVAAGFFPGCFLGVLLSLCSIYWRRRHNERKAAAARAPKPTIAISKPITDGDPQRSDFLRLGSSRSAEVTDGDTKPSLMRQTSTRVRSLFSPNKGPLPSSPPPMQRLSAREPVIPDKSGFDSLESSPSASIKAVNLDVLDRTESIKVFSPPDLHVATLDDAGAGPSHQHAELHQAIAVPLHMTGPVTPVCGAVVPDEDNRDLIQDQDQGRVRRQTTFSEMIDRVGFRSGNGDPYYPVMPTPPGSVKRKWKGKARMRDSLLPHPRLG